MSVATIAVASANEEEHFDVWLRVVETKPAVFQLFTGSITEGDPGRALAESWRVFPAELGEDEQFPFSAVEPGFQLLASQETVDQVLQVDVPAALLRWNGSGFESCDESMLVAFGPASLIADDGPVIGFQFAANSEGFIHDHFEYTLLGPGGADPSPGIYLLPLTITGVFPPLATTPTFYECFNLGQDEEEHEAACMYADLFLACTLDLSGDGTVNAADLGVLLAQFGTKGDGGGLGDLNRDGIVDGSDLGILLGAWDQSCQG
jgi:hypothetical protein